MNYFKWLTFSVVTAVLFQCSDSEPPEPPTAPPLSIRAADISFLPEIREANVNFRNGANEVKDVLDILKTEGCNTIRLRLWHTPATHHSGLDEVTAFTDEIKSKGLKVWLTIHYSDTWADPGAQSKPAAWSSASLSDLADSVYNYTHKVVSLLEPDYVQVGNEINGGFLWPDGNISNQSNFIMLLKKGIDATRSASGSTKIMMHFAGLEGSNWFYTLLENNSVDYDIIALSYYPRWHTKSLTTVKSTMNQLVSSFNKDIILAETGYPFTLGWNDWTNNIVGLSEHLIPSYPATAKGQHDFLMQLRKNISEVNRGLGLAYWAPEWVAYRGTQAQDGSPWENMALFDFDFKVLEGIKVFNE
ncbi:MAG: glycosyl hydrolase 53 family protein [Cyclobacteriaceae bacterium]|nr:glycosyl hydrolase 53 family protein [Cyclobacteriaceae bacterium]